MRKLIYSLPKFKGKQRLLSYLDAHYGSTAIVCRHSVLIEGYYSSIQDCAFLRSTAENSDLEVLILGLKKDAVFVDIGANCGYYSALAARQLSQEGIVVSFEPSLREYRRLIYAINKNSHVATWLPMNVALGEEIGVVKIKIDTAHTGVNHIDPHNDTDGQPCYIVPLDTIIDPVLGSRQTIDLVKIDVEGYELAVLRGMEKLLKEKRILTLQVEITDSFLRRAGASKDELYEFMHQHNYESLLNLPDWQYNEVFKTVN